MGASDLGRVGIGGAGSSSLSSGVYCCGATMGGGGAASCLSLMGAGSALAPPVLCAIMPAKAAAGFPEGLVICLTRKRLVKVQLWSSRHGRCSRFRRRRGCCWGA